VAQSGWADAEKTPAKGERSKASPRRASFG
jgi:hypothetical protein